MKNITLITAGAIAFVLMGINILYNGYLLTAVYACMAAFLHFSGIRHVAAHGDLYWGYFGFASLALVILVGVLLPASWCGRVFVDARVPTKQEQEFIQQQLHAVLDHAKTVMTEQQQKNLRKVSVLVSDRPVIAMPALGRSIIITSLVLNTSTPEELQDVLAHALGYIDEKVGFIFAIIVYANLPLQLVMWLYKFYTRLTLAVSRIFSHEGSLFSLVLLIPLILFSPLALLNYVGKLLLQGSVYCITWLYKAPEEQFVRDLGL